jgi:L-malate glycosyltransferase
VRILYFSHGFTPHDHRILSSLSAAEHEVHFLQLEISRQLDDRPVPAAVKRVHWQPEEGKAGIWKMAALRAAMKKILRDLKPDLVHAGPVQKSAYLTALAGFHPLVTMSWGSDLLVDAHASRVMNRMTRFTLDRTDILVGDCEAVAREAQAFGFQPEDIVLFPWGVDLEHFKPGRAHAFRERLGWEDCFVLLSLRSWEPLYGVDELLKGFVSAARQNPDLRLLLLGGGSQAGLLRKILVDAGMLDRVHFGGRVNQNDLPRYYQAADLYISASHSDGSSVSLMEALACGLPVLVSAIPGNKEWVEEGIHGWFFPTGDSDAVCAGIEKAYLNRHHLDTIQHAARSLAEKRADWSKNFQRLLGAYQLALAKGNRNG